jgi:hypothetical protein
MAVSWVVVPCSLLKLTGVSEISAAAIIRAKEAAGSSETLVNSHQSTWRNNPEDSHLHTRRRENLKSHRLLSSQEALLQAVMN